MVSEQKVFLDLIRPNQERPTLRTRALLFFRVLQLKPEKGYTTPSLTLIYKKIS